MTPLEPGRLVTPNVRLVRQLGRGAMGSVWLADHLTLRTKVAVKFVAEQLAVNDADVLARFTAEATVAAQIKSPHVVQVFDAGIMEDGTPYIVMELLEGETLGARLDRLGRLDVRQVAQIVAQVAKALDKAHRNGVIHRDIKPDNIFLVPSEDELLVKILDFGIAKQTKLEGSSGVTTPGTLVGTPDYMSREQVMHSQAVDAHADMWALAVTTYEALTDHLPFTGENVGATCVNIAMGRFVAPSTLVPELPREVDDWFARAWHAEVDKRFPSAKAMALAFLHEVRTRTDDLEEMLEQTGVFAMPSEIRAALQARKEGGRQGVSMPRAATPVPAPRQSSPGLDSFGAPTPRPRSAGSPGTLPSGARPSQPGEAASDRAPASSRGTPPPPTPSARALPGHVRRSASGRTEVGQFRPVEGSRSSPSGPSNRSGDSQPSPSSRRADGSARVAPPRRAGPSGDSTPSLAALLAAPAWPSSSPSPESGPLSVRSSGLKRADRSGPHPALAAPPVTDGLLVDPGAPLSALPGAPAPSALFGPSEPEPAPAPAPAPPPAAAPAAPRSPATADGTVRPTSVRPRRSFFARYGALFGVALGIAAGVGITLALVGGRGGAPAPTASVPAARETGVASAASVAVTASATASATPSASAAGSASASASASAPGASSAPPAPPPPRPVPKR